MYAVLACHPSITETQRSLVIENRGIDVKESLPNIDRESLNIAVGHNGSSVKYSSEDFITIRDRVAEQLGVVIEQVT